MRITNMMMQNNMLLNINKNAGRTDELNMQIATGKKIGLPSQDPILASRSLRLRASIDANTQYTRNNDQAISWAESTSGAFESVNTQLENILSALTRGANDTMSLSERKDISTSLRAYLDEIQAQMNTTYSGRYVFSGFRTDEPAILTESRNNAYSINQTLSYDDIITGKTYWKKDAQTEAEMENATMIRLPYADCKNITLTDANGASVGLNVTPVSVSSGTNPYANIAANEVRYVEETGELILGADAQAKLLTGDLNINYDKQNFLKGEPNPVVYFKCTELSSVTVQAAPALPVKDPVSGILVSSGSNTNAIQKLDQNGNPVWSNPPTNSIPVRVSYTMDGQDTMSYEVSYNTKIQINSLSCDVLTDQLYSDLHRSISKVLDMQISSESALRLKYSAQGLTGEALTEAIEKQITLETTQIQAIIQDEFGTMLDKITDHKDVVSKEHTDLGARQVRLDVIQVRLEDEFLNLNTLLSNNEDVEYEETITNLLMVQNVYDASLKLTSKIAQMSLLNYM